MITRINIKIRNKRVISSKSIFVYIFLFVIFLPDFYLKNPLWREADTQIKLVLCSFEIISWLLNYKSNRNIVSKKFLSFFLPFETIILISTVLNSGSIWLEIQNIIITIGTILFVNRFAKDDFWAFFSSYIIYIVALLMVNWIFILMFPNGYATTTENYRFNFLGIDNNTTQYVLIAISGMFILKHSWQIKYRTQLFVNLTILLVALQIVSLEVGTGILGMLILIILVGADRYFRINKLLKPQTLFTLSLITFGSIVLLRNDNPLIRFISSALNKDISFTGRTTIWTIVIRHIFERPWIGFGIQEPGIVTTFTRIERAFSPSAHAHCQFLQTTIESGIISIVLIFRFFVQVFKKTKYEWKSAEIRYAVYGIIAFIFVSIVEVVFYDLFWAFLYLVYYMTFQVHGENIR